MEVLKDFLTKRNAAETVYDKVRDSITEAEYIYNMKLPSGKANAMSGKKEGSAATSRYIVADYTSTIDNYAESMLQNFPNLEFEGTKSVSSDEAIDINNIVKKMASANGIYRKLWHVANTGLRKRICVFEVVPKTIIKSGLKIEGGQPVPYSKSDDGNIDIIKYETENVLIDPNAKPDNIADTADYIIVELGIYSKDIFDKMAETNKWDVDSSKIKEEYQYSGNRIDLQEIEIYNTSKGVKVSKMFKSDGMVDVIVNDQYLVASRINVKLVNRMPLNIYVSMHGGVTSYGRSVWELMKQAVYGKSAILNLMLDNVGKALRSPIFTRVNSLANQNLSSFNKDSLVYLSGSKSDRALKDDFFKLDFPDMSQGSILAFNQFTNDISKITRINSMSQGFQEKNVRTNLIAQQLSQGTIEKKSGLLKQAEDTLFAPFGRDVIDIFYNFYDSFPDLVEIDREKFGDIKSVRIKNGSTLDEDRQSELQKLVDALQMMLSTGEDSYDVDKIMDDIFVKMGINDFERYKLDPEQIMLQVMLKMGIAPEMAQQLVPQMLGSIQQLAGGEQQ